MLRTLDDIYAIVVTVDDQEGVLRHDTPLGRVPMMADSLERLAAHYAEADRICAEKGWRWRIAHYHRRGGDVPKVYVRLGSAEPPRDHRDPGGPILFPAGTGGAGGGRSRGRRRPR